VHIELAALKEKKRSVLQLYESDYEADGSNPLSGSPETKWQVQWRAVLERERKVMRELDEMKNQKIEERQARKNLPIISCVGYVNSGKSALVNRITGSDIPSGPQPFSVLEPQVQSFTLPSGTKALMVDTVGFIGELQDVLYYAFRNTLEELSLADVMIHVRDVVHPEAEYQKQNVYANLKRLYLNQQLMDTHHIEVWNKSDLMDKQVLNNKLNDSKSGVTVMPTSAKSGEGVSTVVAKIDSLLKDWKAQS